jgi:hypothetical protein
MTQANSLIHYRNYFYDPEDGGSIFLRNTGNDLKEKSTRNLAGGKVRPARKADNLTAICEPIA